MTNYNNHPTNPKSLAIQEAIDFFIINWPKYDNFNWQKQMNRMMHASFSNWMPKSIKKAAAHVVQTNTDSFPPSMGKIIQTMKDYMGTASLRTAKLQSCSKCTDGFRRLVFWVHLEPNEDRTQKFEMNASCSECEKGASRKTNLKLLSDVETIQKIKNLEIFYFEDREKNRTSKVYNGVVKVKQRISEETKYITKNRYIWLQSMTDEQPPLFFLGKNILEEKQANLEHNELLKERAESKKKHFESLEAIKHKLHEREVEKAIENDEPPPPKPKRVEYISLRQYLFDTKLEHGVRYIYNDRGGNPIIYDHKKI